MHRTFPALLAVLLALSAPVVALPGGAPAATDSGAQSVESGPTTTQGAPPNSTARLALADVTAAGHHEASVDVGAALAVGNGAVDGRYEELAIEERLAAAETDQERVEILRDALDRIDGRVADLREREQAAYRGYADDTVTDRELLREVARVHVEAVHMRTTLETIDRQSRALSASLNRRTQGLIIEVSAFEGPVRERVATAVRGDANSARVHVVTATDGIVLSTIQGDTFVRETYRADQRAPEQAAGKRIDVEERAAEHYPWAWENRDPVDWRGVIDAGLYRVTISHPQGRLKSYIDTGTKNPYREIQQIRVDRMPTTPTANVTEDDLQVQINRTYPGGPVGVTVRNETGAPVSGSVTVDGERLGVTGTDGEQWFVSPRTDYTVNVSHGSTAVSVTVTQTAARTPERATTPDADPDEHSLAAPSVRPVAQLTPPALWRPS